MRGLFIVFEGPDGSGTTSHAQLLSEHLQNHGFEVLLTAEPTSGPIGKLIRHSIGDGERLPASALQLLFTADRAYHVEKIVKPALDAGKIVISDRYFPSTVAYGDALGLDADWLERANGKFLKPDLFLLALPSLEVCLRRLHQRENLDALEEDSLQARVHRAYERWAKAHPELHTFDTSESKEEVSAGLRLVADRLIAEWKAGKPSPALTV